MIMSVDKFQIAYDGDAVGGGSMDVYELAPALLAIGDLIRDANRFFNEERASVSVQVDSDFRRGSFEIAMLIDQSLVEQAKQVLFGGGIVDAAAIFKLVFGTQVVSGGLIFGAVKVYKLFKGKKPESSSVHIIDNSTTIINNIKIDTRSGQLFLNDAYRGEIDRTLKPLAKDGIDTLEVRKNMELIESVTKEDLPERIFESAARESQSGETLTDRREALVKVVKANFEKGKWTFSDGTARFNADVDDPVFREKMDSREIGFYKGDLLRVSLETVQSVKASGKIHTDYVIKRVLEYRPAGTQTRLLPSKKNGE
jgi:hypothetical protein